MFRFLMILMCVLMLAGCRKMAVVLVPVLLLLTVVLLPKSIKSISLRSLLLLSLSQALLHS